MKCMEEANLKTMYIGVTAKGIGFLLERMKMSKIMVMVVQPWKLTKEH